jgi:protein gp37
LSCALREPTAVLLATKASGYDAGASAVGDAPDWYDATWNPTLGCSPLSPGCDHCDALRTVAQLARMGGKAGAVYAGLTQPARGGAAWTGLIKVRQDLLAWPLFRRDARRVLVGTMTDLFHSDLASAVIDQVHAVIAVAHWHRFLVLSKRSERMRAYYSDIDTPRRIAVEIARLAAAVRGEGTTDILPATQTARQALSRAQRRWQPGLDRVVYAAEDGAPRGISPWPLPNLWVGVSVEDQNRLDRVRDLLQTPAALRWVCCEPLLGPIRLDALPIDGRRFDALVGVYSGRDARGRRVAEERLQLARLGWVVAGGEVGDGARPMQADWLRALRDQCIAADVAFLFKRWGEFAPAPANGFGERMVRVGRRSAGRLLDGRSWGEMPASPA